MAKASDPSYRPDWTEWAVDDRQAKQLIAALANPEVAAEIAKAIALDAPSATGMLVSSEAKDGKEDASAAAAPIDARFDTVIAGPWMARWNIVHHNRHGE